METFPNNELRRLPFGVYPPELRQAAILAVLQPHRRLMPGDYFYVDAPAELGYSKPTPDLWLIPFRHCDATEKLYYRLKNILGSEGAFSLSYGGEEFSERIRGYWVSAIDALYLLPQLYPKEYHARLFAYCQAVYNRDEPENEE